MHFNSKMDINVVWVSLCPVNKKIVPYPKSISQKLEKLYLSEDNQNKIEFGKEFYFASIVLNRHTGIHAQHTPPSNFGRYGYKPQGFRNVKRIEVKDESGVIDLNVKSVNGEFRITNEEVDHIIEKIYENISENIIKSNSQEINLVIDTLSIENHDVWKMKGNIRNIKASLTVYDMAMTYADRADNCSKYSNKHASIKQCKLTGLIQVA